jgi:quercetin dioxygenase-like cupin family protein
MLRRKLILSAIAFFPSALLARIKINFRNSIEKGFQVRSGESRSGAHFRMKGVTSNVLDLKVSSKDTEGGFAMFEQTGLSPFGGPPLHIHSYQDETFYVIEGAYQFQVGEDKFEMKAGDTIFLPRKVPHAFVQLTQKGKLIVIYQPAGKMEEFFKKADLWTKPPSQEEIVKVFAESDMQVVGPPLNVDK